MAPKAKGGARGLEEPLSTNTSRDSEGSSPSRRSSPLRSIKSSISEDLFAVSSFRGVATDVAHATSDAVAGIRQWAKHQQELHRAERAAQEERFADDHAGSLYAPRAPSEVSSSSGPTRHPVTPSPDRAIRFLYGAQAKMQLLGGKYEQKPREMSPPSSSSPSRKAGLAQGVQNLVNPLFACGGGFVERARHVSPERKRFVFHSNKEQQEETRHLWDPIMMALGRGSYDDDESLYSLDTQAEDERQQLQRMTSWATNGSMETTGTIRTQGTCDTARTHGEVATLDLPVDDEGNLIPQSLLDAAERRRQKRKARRKKVVKFDYPPIRSIRECPRAAPEDLPNLFFTEEELDEIEEDRENTKAADDVEIVAIDSFKSRDSNQSSRGSRNSNSDGDMRLFGRFSKSLSTDSSGDSNAPVAGFRNYNSTPRLAKKQRDKSPHPFRRFARNRSQEKSRPVPPSPDRDFPSDERDRPPQDIDEANIYGPQDEYNHSLLSRSSLSQEDVAVHPSPPRKKQLKRLVKRVEIYLRERSTHA